MARAGALSAAALAAALLLPAPVLPGDGKESQEAPVDAEVGLPAPDPTVRDWIGGDGRPAMEHFRGEAVLLAYWTTHDKASREWMPTLARLQKELGRQGLTVLAVNQAESREETLRYLAHRDAGPGFAIGIGSDGHYPNNGVPAAALIGPDGRVVWLGPASDLLESVIRRQVKGARRPTAEEAEARAKAMIEAAERDLRAPHLLRAEGILKQVVARYGATPSGKRAAARIPELAAGEWKAEYEAQTELARMVGGVERPAAILDPKAAPALATALREKGAAWRERAPVAARMARDWAAIVSTPWKE